MLNGPWLIFALNSSSFESTGEHITSGLGEDVTFVQPFKASKETF